MSGVAHARELLRVLAVVPDDELFDHLVRDHGRNPHELRMSSLVAIHALEHFDAVVGLLRLDHTHRPAVVELVSAG